MAPHELPQISGDSGGNGSSTTSSSVSSKPEVSSPLGTVKAGTDSDMNVTPPDPSEPHPPLARAIRLVYTDEQGAFQVDPEAVAVLRGVRGPLGVVAVCGRARQGKSFILNQLLGRSSGFKVSPRCKPCTKGLWIWSAPVEVTAADGSSYHLLLLDSEGIDAYDQTGTYAAQIFSLAILLSSLFVYIQMGCIDESSLDRLSMVTEMAKHIRVSSMPSSQGAEQGTEPAGSSRYAMDDLGAYSPVFFWLLRDSYFDLSEGEGGPTSPQDYLESTLQPMPGASEAAKAKNQIRDSIRSLFPDRDCFTLVRPTSEEELLHMLDQMPLDQLRPKFREGLDAFSRAVFARARPKKVGGTVLTGPLLAGLTQAYTDALNNGAVPTILSSWLNVEETECRRAHEAAYDKYIRKYGSPSTADEAEMRALHQAALAAAEAVYREEAVGVGEARQNYEVKLRETIACTFENTLQVAAQAESECNRYLAGVTDKLGRKAWGPPKATPGELFWELMNEIEEYEKAMSGAVKYRCLSQFLKSILRNLVLECAEREIHEAKLQAEFAVKGARATEGRASFEADKAKEHERMQVLLQEEKHNLETQLEAANKAKAALELEQQRLQDARAALSAECDRKLAAELQANIELMEKKVEEAMSYYKKLLNANSSSCAVM